MKLDMLSLDYFVAAVPAGTLFKMDLDDLKDMVSSPKKEEASGLNPIAQVCLIGLVSYFEAFCKNQFASLINICPLILNSFCEKRTDTSIKIIDLLALDLNAKNKLGFLLAEKYDFGSAKEINSLYKDLLSITPFSKDQMKKYEMLLNDRNLLVHHGGIFTMKYHKQTFKKQSLRNRVYFDSLVISKEDFLQWAEFVEHIVIKIIHGSFQALTKFIDSNKLELLNEHKKAFEYLQGYD